MTDIDKKAKEIEEAFSAMAGAPDFEELKKDFSNFKRDALGDIEDIKQSIEDAFTGNETTFKTLNKRIDNFTSRLRGEMRILKEMMPQAGGYEELAVSFCNAASLIIDQAKEAKIEMAGMFDPDVLGIQKNINKYKRNIAEFETRLNNLRKPRLRDKKDPFLEQFDFTDDDAVQKKFDSYLSDLEKKIKRYDTLNNKAKLLETSDKADERQQYADLNREARGYYDSIISSYQDIVAFVEKHEDVMSQLKRDSFLNEDTKPFLRAQSMFKDQENHIKNRIQATERLLVKENLALEQEKKKLNEKLQELGASGIEDTVDTQKDLVIRPKVEISDEELTNIQTQLNSRKYKIVAEIDATGDIPNPTANPDGTPSGSGTSTSRSSKSKKVNNKPFDDKKYPKNVISDKELQNALAIRDEIKKSGTTLSSELQSILDTQDSAIQGFIDLRNQEANNPLTQEEILNLNNIKQSMFKNLRLLQKHVSGELQIVETGIRTEEEASRKLADIKEERGKNIKMPYMERTSSDSPNMTLFYHLNSAMDEVENISFDRETGMMFSRSVYTERFKEGELPLQALKNNLPSEKKLYGYMSELDNIIQANVDEVYDSIFEEKLTTAQSKLSSMYQTRDRMDYLDADDIFNTLRDEADVKNLLKSLKSDTANSKRMREIQKEAHALMNSDGSVNYDKRGLNSLIDTIGLRTNGAITDISDDELKRAEKLLDLLKGGNKLYDVHGLNGRNENIFTSWADNLDSGYNIVKRTENSIIAEFEHEKGVIDQLTLTYDENARAFVES